MLGKLFRQLLPGKRSAGDEPYAVLGYIEDLIESGDTDEARVQLDEKEKSAHQDPARLHAFARFWLELGEPVRALELLFRASRLAQPDAELQMTIAQALADNNDPLEALHFLMDAERLAPHSAVVKLRLGQILLGQDCLYHAREKLHEATRIDPGNAKAWADLGLACLFRKEVQDAWRYLDKAIRLDPALSAPRINLGRLALLSGHYESAVVHLSEALRLCPHDKDLQIDLERARQGLIDSPASPRPTRTESPHSLTISDNYDAGDAVTEGLREVEHLIAAGDIIAAEEKLIELCHSWPENPWVFWRLGRFYLNCCRFSEAEVELRHAASLDGSPVDVNFDLAQALLKNNQKDEALTLSQTILERNPNDINALILHASLLDETKRLDDSIPFWRAALKAQPEESSKLLLKLGQALFKVDKLAESVETLERAVALNPDQPEGRRDLGWAYIWAGEFDKSLEQFNAILTLDPGNFQARWYKSWHDMARQRFTSGWPDLELRFVAKAIRPRPLPFPLWRGENLSGKTLLISAEQGIGDEIMFASCLPALLAQAERCFFECNERLLPLFQRSFPGVTILRGNYELYPPWLSELPPIDYYVNAGSLPGYFRRNVEDFPKPSLAYLVPDTEAVNQWRAELAALGSGIKVGISWRGGSSSTRHRARSMKLTDWKDILRISDCHFVNLQYGDCAADIEEVRAMLGVDIYSRPEAIADLDQFAALVASLDLVVTVCNATVHFAGAQGQPAWVIAPFVAEWRYGWSGEFMPWYSSVRIFRQEALGDWSAPLGRIERELHDVARRHFLRQESDAAMNISGFLLG